MRDCEKLTQILSKYILNYIKTHGSLKKILNWSNRKIEDKFNSFLKYISKIYDMNFIDITQIYENTFTLNNRNMCVFYNCDFTVQIPSFKEFWCECIKYISTHYQGGENRDQIKDLVNLYIQKICEPELDISASLDPIPDIIDPVLTLAPTLAITPPADTPLYYLEDLENVFYQPNDSEKEHKTVRIPRAE